MGNGYQHHRSCGTRWNSKIDGMKDLMKEVQNQPEYAEKHDALEYVVKMLEPKHLFLILARKDTYI